MLDNICFLDVMNLVFGIEELKRNMFEVVVCDIEFTHLTLWIDLLLVDVVHVFTKCSMQLE